MKRALLAAGLLVAAPGLAAEPPREARACQGEAPRRDIWPNGTLLWGTARQVAEEEASSVLASASLGQVRLGGKALKGLRIEEGRLVAPARESLVGAVLEGQASDGQPVRVALCGAEPAAGDPSVTWYRLEVWKPESGTWENPCTPTARALAPRALAVQGVWDGSGARREVPGKFTFACENGAIAKCIQWGYKPWAMREGRSLQGLHQACTRMVRADYCGDGRGHTREDSTIDMYDSLQVNTRTTEAVTGWDPARASFEAAWTPEGAFCLARTREGQAVEAIVEQCPGRFEAGVEDLGEGDRCSVRRKGVSAPELLLRNRSYPQSQQTAF